jgi:hypothetical protein
MKSAEAEIRDLADRRGILDCVHRYCHGMDRLDRELVLSAYHDDAWDDHGTLCGPVAEFVDFTFKRHREFLTETHHHYVTNHLCEIEGDTAHATTYFLYVATPTREPCMDHEPETILTGGRYVDRLERRGDRWGIVDRVCIIEWNGAMASRGLPATAGLPLTGVAARDRSDLQYQRPLRVERSRS